MDRTMETFFFVLCVVCFPLVHGSRRDFCDGEKLHTCSYCEQNCVTRNTVPAYILYILGFLSILLLLVSIFLIYVLVKTKFLRTLNICNRYRNTLTLTLETVENGRAQIQKSQEKTKEATYHHPPSPFPASPGSSLTGGPNLDKTTSELKNENEYCQTLKKQNSENTIASEYNTLRIPKKTEVSGNITPKLIKAAKDMPTILPEQMSLICQEVLKRNVSHDSTSSLQNIDQFVKDGKPADERLSKCASTPDLDIYDKLPTPLSYDEKKSTEKPIIPPEKMSLLCQEMLKRTAKRTPTSSLEDNDQLVKEGKPAEKIVSKFQNKTKKDDSISNKSRTLNIDSKDDGSETGFEIYDCPKTQEYAQDCIYDLPKESTAKQESSYIAPYFSAKPLSSETFNTQEEKLNYAQTNDLSFKQSATENECKDAAKTGKVTNESNASNDSVYEFPKNNISNQMYINANEIPSKTVKE